MWQYLYRVIPSQLITPLFQSSSYLIFLHLNSPSTMSNPTSDIELGNLPRAHNTQPQRARTPPSPSTASVTSTIWKDRFYFVIVVLVLTGIIIAIVASINVWALKDKRAHPDENFGNATVVAKHIFERFWPRVQLGMD